MQVSFGPQNPPDIILVKKLKESDTDSRALLCPSERLREVLNQIETMGERWRYEIGDKKAYTPLENNPYGLVYFRTVKDKVKVVLPIKEPFQEGGIKVCYFEILIPGKGSKTHQFHVLVRETLSSESKEARPFVYKQMEFLPIMEGKRPGIKKEVFLPKIYFVHKEDGDFTIRRRFLRGPSLAQIIFDSRFVLSLPRIIDVMITVTRQVDFYHRELKGSHTDLTSANIVTERFGRDDETVSVIDFDFLDSTSESNASLIQYPAVNAMAPEVCNLKNTKEKCDSWSLGILLLELIRRDYVLGRDESEEDYIGFLLKNEEIINQRFQKLIDTSVPKPLVPLLERMLKVNPDQRISIQDILVELIAIQKSLSQSNHDSVGF